MACPDEQRLWKQYILALDRYIDAAKALRVCAPAALKAQVKLEARAKDLCAAARRAWEDHVGFPACPVAQFIH